MSDYKKFAELVVDYLRQAGVDYGEVRVMETVSESVSVKNGKVDHVSEGWDLGFGVRVFKRGFMGFASSNELSAEAASRVVKRAVELAEAAAVAGGEPYRLDDEPYTSGKYETPVKIDPFSVPLEEKIDLLVRVDEVLAKKPQIRLRVGRVWADRYTKVFANTLGALQEQVIVHTGGGYTAYAFSEAEMQTRSYPAPHGGNAGSGGWEIIADADFLGNAERVAEEAVALLSAPPAPEGEMDLVIGTHQMVLQLHESIGHALELDRVLGYEASYAGTSFATIDKLGNFQYGSPLLNVVADTTTPGGLGTYGWDDEGTSARKEYLIKEGILVNYLSSRDTAPVIGKRSTAAARASSWNRIPIVRMVNVNLEPGDKSVEELIAMVDDGLYVDSNRSWSIDQRRLNFQFGTEIGYRIRKGKLAEMVKNPVYWGITPEFWRSLAAVANDWKLWGIPNCGKGEPGQSMHVGHGTATSLFRRVKVGSVKS